MRENEKEKLKGGRTSKMKSADGMRGRESEGGSMDREGRNRSRKSKLCYQLLSSCLRAKPQLLRCR